MKKFIANIPKIELHVHLEGTLEPELLLKLANRNKIKLPYQTIQQIQNSYKHLTNLSDFLKLYYQGTNVLQTEQDFYDLTFSYLERCHQYNVRHIEPFFDPQAHTSRGVKFQSVINGIHRALVDAKKQFGISFGLIMCFLRDQPVEDAMKTLESAYKYKDKIIAVGLDSDEIGHPPSKFAKVFEKANEMGFLVTAHGGHDGEPYPYVSELLELKGIKRIDHGVRCIEDEKLVSKILERKLPLTVCPISNVKIGPYKTMKDHPIKQLLDKGLCVSVNSDDPAYLGASIVDNFVEVVDTFQLKESDVVKLVKNAIHSSFLSDKEKLALIKEVDDFVNNNLT